MRAPGGSIRKIFPSITDYDRFSLQPPTAAAGTKCRAETTLTGIRRAAGRLEPARAPPSPCQWRHERRK
jgi:hypothetical protein